MKTIIIIAIIISIIMVFDIVTIEFFENEVSFFDESVKTIIYSIDNGDYDEAEAALNTMNNYWQKNRILWNMLCDHEEAEEISKLLTTALLSFEHNQFFICKVALKNLNLTVEFAGDKYSLLIDNIS